MGCRPSTILPNTTRLSGMLLRGDVCLITFCFQTVWAFLTLIQAPFPTSGIHPVFLPLILCSARILRSYRTASESRPIGLTPLISVD